MALGILTGIKIKIKNTTNILSIFFIIRRVRAAATTGRCVMGGFYQWFSPLAKGKRGVCGLSGANRLRPLRGAVGWGVLFPPVCTGGYRHFTAYGVMTCFVYFIIPAATAGTLLDSSA